MLRKYLSAIDYHITTSSEAPRGYHEAELPYQ